MAAGDSMAGMQMATYRLHVLDAPRSAYTAGTLLFQITDTAGTPVTSYDTMHQASMHLLSVERSSGSSGVTDFQHLHPEYVGNGTWRVDGYMPHRAGEDHIVADFTTGGVMAEAHEVVPIDGCSGAVPDNSGGYEARVVGTGSGPEGATLKVQLVQPDGRATTNLNELMGATAHLALWDPTKLARGTTELGFDHAHADTPIDANGVLTVDVGKLAAGHYQGWLQVATADGVAHAVPVNVNWPGS